MTANSNCLRAALSLSAALIAGVILLASVAPLQAANWPERPIKIIVPFAPGGAIDLIARLLQESMGKTLGGTVIVENQAGGAGVPASETVVRAPPDGYTLGIFSSNWASNAILQPHLSFDPVKDTTPISLVAINTAVIVVPPSSSIHTLKDLVEQAKAKPGTIGYATPGFGTAMHFAGELFKTQAKIDIVHVPYRGAGPELNDLLGAHVPVGISGIGPVQPHILSGKLRALAITTSHRSKSLPDVPTVAEQGYPGYNYGDWFAMLAPKGLPPDIANRIHDAYVTAMSAPAYKARLEKIGLEPTSTSSAELGKFLASEVERIRQIAIETKMLEKK